MMQPERQLFSVIVLVTINNILKYKNGSDMTNVVDADSPQDDTYANSEKPNSRAEKVFRIITAKPWFIIIICIGLLAATAISLPKLTRDTTADAFIDPDEPALLYRNRVEQIFGLEDPMVIAVVDRNDQGVFNPDTLALIKSLSESVQRLNNIDPERVTSIATENNIFGDAEGLIIESFYKEDGLAFSTDAGTQERAEEVRRAVQNLELMNGNLVSKDGSTAIIVVEMADEEFANKTYLDLMTAVESVDRPDQVELHVAGAGAVSGYLASYIDQDARRVNPLAVLIITVTLIVTFISFAGAIVPNFIVVFTVLGSFGIMAASGVSFFVITNGLIVNLIGIAVADSIHILSQFYTEMRKRPADTRRNWIVRAMVKMWRPVTLTTITTIAGFLALSASTVMPPMYYFGIFGALGVFLAWFYSMTLLPAVMTVWKTNRIPRPFRSPEKSSDNSLSSRVLRKFGRGVLAQPYIIVVLAGIILVAGGMGTTRIVVNDAQIENFQKSEPIYRADKSINAAMDGTYFLDVMIETDYEGALYETANLNRIEALQEFMKNLPNVNGSVSLVDYVKQLNRSVNDNAQEAYVVPDDPLLTSQLFFLYTASSSPTDFDEEVDTGFQNALVRANVNKNSYLSNSKIVPPLEEYLRNEFNSAGIKGTASGRITVDYYWLHSIATNTIKSVVYSFGAVLLIAMILFRSVVGGMIASIPVAVAVLFVYAIMGYSGVWLGVGASLFAAISIGLAIDFAIHTLDRLKELVSEKGFNDEALLEFFPTTGRALFFNFVAVTMGFGVLTTSDVPPLVRFGAFVAIAVSAAFISAITVVPAVIKITKPKFLTA